MVPRAMRFFVGIDSYISPATNVFGNNNRVLYYSLSSQSSKPGIRDREKEERSIYQIDVDTECN